MKFCNLLFMLYILLTFQTAIKNGVYIFISNDLYLSLYKKKISLSHIFDRNTYFRIKKINKNFNSIAYYIEEIHNNYKLNILDNKELIFNNKKNNFNQWNFIKLNDNDYLIKNNNNCYIKRKDLKLLCDIQFDGAIKFKLIKIYSEINYKTDTDILKNEPIDVLIKYIDLRDPNLNRSGIHQIDKDFDNEELRYSIRSILNNIPWIRKIFILMPNDKVRFFKEYIFIKEKIIYVKDKDFLGYDSSNCNAFLFRYWKMKQFGISNNIIVMDDDYFIGKKLEKKDFFYVKKGKVLPLITTYSFLKIEQNSLEINYQLYKERAENSKEEQNDDVFNYSKFLTLSYILKILNISNNETVYIPKFTHNAIPVNLNDIKEIYELTYKSPYKFATLDCLYRIYGYLQFQIFVLSYTFLKYKRKVKMVPGKFVRINDSIFENYGFDLFCINKGEGNYSILSYYKAKIVMEKLFPIPSPYEIIDNSLQQIAFNVVYAMNKEIDYYEKNNYGKVSKNIFFNLLINHFYFFVFVFIKFNYRIIFY